MNYKKLFGYGVLIWAVPYLLATGLVAYKLAETTWATVLMIIVVAIVAYLAARGLNLNSAKEILKYSVSWAVIVIVLDVIFTVPFTGWEFFKDWTMWLAYALIIVAPLVAIKK